MREAVLLLQSGYSFFAHPRSIWSKALYFTTALLPQ